MENLEQIMSWVESSKNQGWLSIILFVIDKVLIALLGGLVVWLIHRFWHQPKIHFQHEKMPKGREKTKPFYYVFHLKNRSSTSVRLEKITKGNQEIMLYEHCSKHPPGQKLTLPCVFTDTSPLPELCTQKNTAKEFPKGDFVAECSGPWPFTWFGQTKKIVSEKKPS